MTGMYAKQGSLPVVLLTDPIDPAAAAGIPAVVKLLGEPGFAELKEALPKSDVVIVRRKIPADLLSKARGLRALVRNGAGLDFIPVEVASDLGIAVVNTPSANATSVAEATVGMMLSGSRNIAYKDRSIRGGQWDALRQNAFKEREISGKRLGLIGFGVIAQKVAQICHFGFGMEVAATTRSHRTMPDYVTALSLDDLLRQSDMIVLACPLTRETKGLIGSREIALMKSSAGFINIARGAIVREAALIEGLREGRLGFAALDVFAEQPLQSDSGFLALDNVILTPHTAGITQESMRLMSTMAAAETRRILNGQRPQHLVNAEVWDRIQRRWDSYITKDDINPAGVDAK